MSAIRKKIIITTEIYKGEETTTIQIFKFNDFEAIGVLSYYKDAITIKAMHSTKEDKEIDKTNLK